MFIVNKYSLVSSSETAMIMKINIDRGNSLQENSHRASTLIVGHENIYLVKSAVSEDLTKLFLHVKLYLFDISDHDHDTSYKFRAELVTCDDRVGQHQCGQQSGAGTRLELGGPGWRTGSCGYSGHHWQTPAHPVSSRSSTF